MPFCWLYEIIIVILLFYYNVQLVIVTFGYDYGRDDIKTNSTCVHGRGKSQCELMFWDNCRNCHEFLQVNDRVKTWVIYPGYMEVGLARGELNLQNVSRSSNCRSVLMWYEYELLGFEIRYIVPDTRTWTVSYCNLVEMCDMSYYYWKW